MAERTDNRGGRPEEDELIFTDIAHAGADGSKGLHRGASAEEKREKGGKGQPKKARSVKVKDNGGKKEKLRNKKSKKSDKGAKPADEKKGRKASGKRGKKGSADEDKLDTSSIALARGISHEERRRRQTRRDLIKIGCVLLALGLIAAGLVYGYHRTIVEHISVTGSSHYGEAQLLSMSGIRAGRSIFFYSENSLRNDMNSIPDIRTVSVNKSMPNRIDIVVSDITASAAILSPNGVYTLISSDGYVLSMGESTNKGLITIEGMTGVGFALNTYIDRQNSTIRTVGAVRMIQAIENSPIKDKVRSIDLASSAYVTLSLDNNYTIVLGSLSTAPECVSQAAEAYERFLPVYPNGGTLHVFRGSTVVDFTPAE